MKSWAELYKRNPVIKFMCSYILILIIPLCICIKGYNIAFDITEQQIKENNLAMLDQVKDVVDNRLESIKSFSMQLATNASLISLVEETEYPDENFFIESKLIIDYISQMIVHLDTTLVKNIYVYFDELGYVITPNTMYQAEFYHKNILSEYASFDAWRQSLMEGKEYSSFRIDEEGIKYVQAFPIQYNMPKKGAIVCQIDTDQFSNIFSSIDAENGALVYIYDENGNMIWSMGEDEQSFDYFSIAHADMTQSGISDITLDSQDMISVHTISDKNNWLYTVLVSRDVVMKDLIQIKRTIYKMLLVVTVIGLLISYYLSVKNGKPLRTVIRELNQSNREKNLFAEEIHNIDDLGGAINKLVYKTDALEEELRSQQPLLETALLQKAVNGEFSTEEEMYLFAQMANVNIESGKQRIIACRVFANNEFYNIDKQTLEEVNIALILIKNALKEIFNKKIYFYDVDYLTTVLIVQEDVEDKQVIERKIKEANAYIIANYYITPAWGIGNICTSWLEIWRGYEQAKKALKEGVKEGYKRIIFYDEISSNEATYYYPLNFEKRLVNYCKYSESNNIKDLVGILYVENFEKRRLSNQNIDNLYRDTIKTIEHLTGEVNDKVKSLESLKGRYELHHAREYFDVLLQVCLDISADTKKEEYKRQEKLIDRIEEYIQQVYTDPSLGLGMVASHFNISEGYTSTLFKEQTGINFAEYIEKIRMEQACNLLKDTSLNINDIGEQVGYNSAQSFRRAFKRIHGITPSQLRKRVEC